jgi:hypothetical protein
MRTVLIAAGACGLVTLYGIIGSVAGLVYLAWQIQHAT